MRIALYHDLPAGGALRFLRDATVSTSDEHSYVLMVVGDESVDPVLAGAVNEVRRVKVSDLHRALPGRVGALSRALGGQVALAREIDEGDFDLAVFHPAQMTQAPFALAHLRKVPSFYYAPEPRRRAYEHGYQPWLDRGSRRRRAFVRTARRVSEPLLTRLDRAATLGASLIATNSAFSVESIARAYGRDAFLCHPGVRLDQFTLSESQRERMVVSVGALDPTKGHDLIVDALACIPAASRPAFTVVHERLDEAFRDKLIDRARRASVDLRIVSNISDAELVEYYGRACATVAAARLEPFGLTPIESMAVGTPVLAVREGGFRETVQSGTNGLLVDRSIDALAVGLIAILELADLVDPSTVRKSLTPYWSWERCVDDYQALLERAVAR